MTLVDIAELTSYPGNPRRGDVDVIVDSLKTHGQYRPIVVQRSTGHVLAGNHTMQAAESLGWQQIDVHYVDVDDETAARIVIVDNRSADKGHYDTAALADILRELPNLDGTGYTDDEYAKLLESLTGEDDLPGDEEGEGGPIDSYSLEFSDEQQRAEWYSFLAWLADTYPDRPTDAARLTEYLQATEGDR